MVPVNDYNSDSNTSVVKKKMREKKINIHYTEQLTNKNVAKF